MRWKLTVYLAVVVASFSLGAASISLAQGERAPQPVTLAPAQFNALLAQLRTANSTLGDPNAPDRLTILGELRLICEAQRDPISC
jgi:hypothetical protein